MIPSGLAAMGKPIPNERRQAAYDAARSMGVKEPWRMISGMAEQLQRDKPYEAMEIAKRYIDLTGAYRIMAHLLT